MSQLTGQSAPAAPTAPAAPAAPAEPAERSDAGTPTADRRKPFYDVTVRLLGCVRDQDLTTLSALCDDDFGIVEITTTGGSLVIRDRAAWEEWFTGLFAQLDTMQARTWSEITGYEAVVAGDMATASWTSSRCW